MKKDHALSSWLIANIVLLISGALMTWFILGFEPPPQPNPISGWSFIFARITTSIELLLQYGFAWLWILSLIEGVGGAFVTGYIVFKVISIVSPKAYTGNKVLSIALIVVLMIFLFRELLYGPNLPLPGYWTFMLGLFSSALFEWRNSMTENIVTDT